MPLLFARFRGVQPPTAPRVSHEHLRRRHHLTPPSLHACRCSIAKTRLTSRGQYCSGCSGSVVHPLPNSSSREPLECQTSRTLMDGTGESESTGDGYCWGDGEKGHQTLIDRRNPTLAETDNCFPRRGLCHQVAADGWIKLDNSKNIWETTPASGDRGSLGCTRIAC